MPAPIILVPVVVKIVKSSLVLVVSMIVTKKVVDNIKPKKEYDMEDEIKEFMKNMEDSLENEEDNMYLTNKYSF